MVNFKDVNSVRKLKANIDFIFNTPQGKEVMEYLEEACGWYESVWDINNRDLTLINDGKRQVIATIKTILRLSPQEIVDVVKSKEDL